MSRSRSVFLGLAVAGVSALSLAGPALAAELTVPMDEVRMMTFRGSIRTVVVGNPVVADVSVADDRHIFIVGKNIGSTNVVVLNAEGVQVANELINVTGKTNSVVTLQRGSGQTTWNCAADRCHQMPVPGDATEPFTALAGQINARETTARNAAGAVAQAEAAQNGGQQQQ